MHRLQGYSHKHLTQIFHTEPYPASLQIHIDYFDRHDIAHADDLERAVDVAVGQLADVHQAVLLDADVDEGAEVDHIAQITITMALPSHLSSQLGDQVLNYLSS